MSEHSPFRLRGAMEAFYGTFYSFPERYDLIRFLGSHDFNFYLYGPKNDRQHRMRWWEHYPPAVMDDFAEAIRLGREVGVEFCYSLSFGVPMNYASEEDLETVIEKFHLFYDLGCRSFGLLFDDITEGFVHDVNRRQFRDVAEAHANVSNRVLEWARSLDSTCRLFVCPSEYHGTAPFSHYLREMGELLAADIALFYTGPAICSAEITAEQVEGFAQEALRVPLIWDNYPANDLQMRSEMHVGPLLHRDPRLSAVSAGYVANLMNQKEASKVALLTIKEYLHDPGSYDQDAAWTRALREVGGESYEPLRCFAENSLASCLQREDAPRMDALASAALAEVEAGVPTTQSGAIGELNAYLDRVDESCYHLKNRMKNLSLRQNILPWVEALEDKLWLVRYALRCISAVEEGRDPAGSAAVTRTLVDDIRRSARRIGGTAALDVARYALDRADGAMRQSSGSTATPTMRHQEAHVDGAVPHATQESNADRAASGMIEGI